MKMIDKFIDKLALISIKDGRLLVARSKGKACFYIPGGKREPNEDDNTALKREVSEELASALKPHSIRYANTFSAQAHGKQAGVMVRTTCYFADLESQPIASSEIEELAWLDHSEKHQCSLVTQMIMDWLAEEKLLHNAAPLEKKPNISLKKYKWIVFDADNTIFHFRDQIGLTQMFKKHGIDFKAEDYQNYKSINKRLWESYENGLVSANELANQRFAAWAKKLNTTPAKLNNDFLDVMATVCTPLPGAVKLLNSLKGKVKLGIITNGFTSLQYARLKHNNLVNHFDFVVTSEEAGKAKPHPDIFNHAITHIGKVDMNEILMVGDNPLSDILGGNNMGMDTCWLNVNNKPQPTGVHADFQVSELAELQSLLCKNNSTLCHSSSNLWQQAETEKNTKKKIHQPAELNKHTKRSNSCLT
jgi:5'-nucleotidase